MIHGSIVHPQYAGEITAKKLGFDIDIFNEDGLPCKPGMAGELVIKHAFPSAAVEFWGDTNNKKYSAAYFETFPGM